MTVSPISTWREDAGARAVAIAGTLVLLVVAGRFLWNPPGSHGGADGGAPRVQLVFSVRAGAEAAPPPQEEADSAAAAARPVGTRTPAQAAATLPAATAVAADADADAPVRLYDDEGRLRLPDGDRWAGTTAAPRVAPGSGGPPPDAADRLLHRPNPVQARTTRFAKDWISDGDAADVAQQEIARAQRKIAEVLLGREIEHAKARPSPEVRFNPGRHERTADLGSEATGDAYKAAPIDYEPAPGLDGEASRRIREQVAALERRYARCDRARLQRLMQPLLAHLDELQKAEAAYARGADPIRAEHQLPNAANGAYDMARRALWYADSRMAGCPG